MPGPVLPHLPTELLRQICDRLPCSSALSFLLVCRSIYQVCNDWVVWREVVNCTPEFSSSAPLGMVRSPDGWKRLVIIAAKGTSVLTQWTPKNVTEWLPHIIALGHRDLLQSDLSSLGRICRATIYSAYSTPAVELVDTGRSTTTANYPDLPDWRVAQAAAFCLAMQSLSRPIGHRERPSAELRHIPWPRTVELRQREVSLEDRERHVSIQHALANYAVGVFATELRHALADRSTNYQSFLVSALPTAGKIQLGHVLDLLLPLRADGLAKFSLRHLPAATEATFFTQDEWTGFIGFQGTSFMGIGGCHRDGFARGDRSEPPGNFPNGRHFEGILRFHFARELDDGRYELRSNNFHSEAGLHNIQMIVEHGTGRVTIRHWHPLSRAGFELETDGIITPFGVISRLVEGGIWLWMWKKVWCT